MKIVQKTYVDSTEQNDTAVIKCDRLCSLVVRVPGYRSRGPGLILGATTFSEK
jgi:hypothetical protein